MKIGVCTGIDDIGKAAAAGYDYVELSLSGITALDDNAFNELTRRLDECGIDCDACNLMLPSGISLYKDNPDEIDVYVNKAYNRAARLGVKYVVFGSGRARRYDESIERNAAWEALVKTARRFGDIALENNLIITMEPLNKKECNILVSVSEALSFVKEVNHPNVKLLADFYHMRIENEAMDILTEAGDFLKHTHIANSNGRVFPFKNDEDIYNDFFNALRKADYNGGVSIEAGTKSFEEDSGKSIKFIKNLLV